MDVKWRRKCAGVVIGEFVATLRGTVRELFVQKRSEVGGSGAVVFSFDNLLLVVE